ncbi:MAG TPA: YdcF family protein [Bacillota bacterium]|nr:YdcF family protein [Bacillota bacterium]
MKQLIYIIFWLLGVWFVIHVAIISVDGLNDDLGVADVGIVLGNKVENDGQPSKRLKSRLDKAVELLRNRYCKYLIVSGGVGKEGYDEAEVMKDYLVKRYVPDNKIFIDRAGSNTYLTACNSKRILARLRLDSVLLISQYYHLTRTRLAFFKAGFKKIYSAHANFFEIRDCYSLVREFFGYYKYLFLKPLKR